MHHAQMAQRFSQRCTVHIVERSLQACSICSACLFLWMVLWRGRTYATVNIDINLRQKLLCNQDATKKPIAYAAVSHLGS